MIFTYVIIKTRLPLCGPTRVHLVLNNTKNSSVLDWAQIDSKSFTKLSIWAHGTVEINSLKNVYILAPIKNAPVHRTSVKREMFMYMRDFNVPKLCKCGS